MVWWGSGMEEIPYNSGQSKSRRVTQNSQGAGEGSEEASQLFLLKMALMSPPPKIPHSSPGVLCGKTQFADTNVRTEGGRTVKKKSLPSLHCVKPPCKLEQRIDPPCPLQGLELCKRINSLCRLILPC